MFTQYTQLLLVVCQLSTFIHASARAVCQLSYQYIYSDQILPINMFHPHLLMILVDRMSGPGSIFMACIIVVAVCVSSRQHIDSIPYFLSIQQ